jgi:glycosyltransferase involved in cell wall biosynthesis
MKILYDYQFFEYQKFGGITKYFSEIISAFSEETKFDIGIKYSNNIHLKEKKLIPVYPLNNNLDLFCHGLKFPGRRKLFRLMKHIYPEKYFDCYQENIKYSVDLLKKQDYDIFHPTYYNDYFLESFKDKPLVITIHDMIYEKFPEYFPAYEYIPFLKEKLINRADHIIAVSENTKKDLINISGVNPEKISVIYHGANKLVENNNTQLNVPKNYLLFVGSRYIYKNFFFLIYSIANILIERDIYLICTGTPFAKDELILFKNLKIENRILNYVASEDELGVLYKNAIAFIFPSLYEGFGIPILEAFANNCPCLISNTSCFPEIADDAALYFDPKSRTEIQNQVNKIIDSPSLREELISKGEKRMQAFSWEKASKETVAVYKQLL